VAEKLGDCCINDIVSGKASRLDTEEYFANRAGTKTMFEKIELLTPSRRSEDELEEDIEVEDA
jgi:hypothetical protein